MVTVTLPSSRFIGPRLNLFLRHVNRMTGGCLNLILVLAVVLIDQNYSKNSPLDLFYPSFEFKLFV